MRVHAWGILTCCLTACAAEPTVTPVASAPDVFVIERESPLQHPPPAQLAEQVRADAVAHCAGRGADAQEIDAQASKGWNVTGNVPVFRMRFRCLPRPAAAVPAAAAAPGAGPDAARPGAPAPGSTR